MLGRKEVSAISFIIRVTSHSHAFMSKPDCEWEIGCKKLIWRSVPVWVLDPGGALSKTTHTAQRNNHGVQEKAERSVMLWKVAEFVILTFYLFQEKVIYLFFLKSFVSFFIGNDCWGEQSVLPQLKTETLPASSRKWRNAIFSCNYLLSALAFVRWTEGPSIPKRSRNEQKHSATLPSTFYWKWWEKTTPKSSLHFLVKLVRKDPLCTLSAISQEKSQY